jgi:hypothetical protein
MGPAGQRVNGICTDPQAAIQAVKVDANLAFFFLLDAQGACSSSVASLLPAIVGVLFLGPLCLSPDQFQE